MGTRSGTGGGSHLIAVAAFHPAGRAPADEPPLERRGEGDLASVERLAVVLDSFPKPNDPAFRGERGLYERGGEGETILHIAVLLKRAEVAKWIVRRFPSLVNDIYVKRRYYGETALHIACVGGNLDLVKFLVANGAKVNGPLASGTEFRKDVDKGCLYYGQTPLQFAACNNHFEVVKFLVEEAGARLEAIDAYGNNVLHVLAYYGSINLEIYEYLMKKNKEQLENKTATINISTVRNKQHYTPFQVGISRGHKRIIETIKDTVWQFGFVRQYRVPLVDLDPIQTHSSEDQPHKRVSKSALEIACEREDKVIMNTPLFEALLKVKWTLYARRKFIARLFFTVLLVVCMTVSIALQPSELADRQTYSIDDPESIARAIFELLTIAGTLIMISFEVRDVIRQRLEYFSGYGSGENVVQWTFSVLILILPIVRFAIGKGVGDNLRAQDDVRDVENVLLGFVAIVGWMYVLFFAKGFPALGPLTLIFNRILLGDLLEWMALYATFTVGFACALYLQMNEVPRGTGPELIRGLDWNVLPGALLWTVRFAFAQGIFDDFRRSKLPAFTEFLFILYGFLAVILLVNMLIAKLTETFKEIALDSKRQWTVQFAYLIMEIDSRLSDREKKHILRHLGDRDPDADPLSPRYFVFTERTHEPSPTEKVTSTMKLVVTSHMGRDVEVRTDLDHWRGLANDFAPKSRENLWVGHPATIESSGLEYTKTGKEPWKRSL